MLAGSGVPGCEESVLLPGCMKGSLERSIRSLPTSHPGQVFKLWPFNHTRLAFQGWFGEKSRDTGRATDGDKESGRQTE